MWLEEEEAWGMFWWQKILEKEEEKEKPHCPKCGSKRVAFEKVRQVWYCLQCSFEWK